MIQVLDGLFRDYYDPPGIFRDKDGNEVDGMVEPLRTQIHEGYVRIEKEWRDDVRRREEEHGRWRDGLRRLMGSLVGAYLRGCDWGDPDEKQCCDDIMELIDDAE